jgi:hypothetical protein
VKAITVRQPFASRLVHGTKRVENRSWSTPVRGRILIHAGATPHDLFARHRMEHLPMKALVGSVQLVDVHSSETCGDRCADVGGFPTGLHTTPGTPWFHWVVTDPIAFDESDIVHGPGALGFWDVEQKLGPSVEHLVRIAAEAARRV